MSVTKKVTSREARCGSSGGNSYEESPPRSRIRLDELSLFFSDIRHLSRAYFLCLGWDFDMLVLELGSVNWLWPFMVLDFLARFMVTQILAINFANRAKKPDNDKLLIVCAKALVSTFNKDIKILRHMRQFLKLFIGCRCTNWGTLLTGSVIFSHQSPMLCCQWSLYQFQINVWIFSPSLNTTQFITFHSRPRIQSFINKISAETLMFRQLVNV